MRLPACLDSDPGEGVVRFQVQRTIFPRPMAPISPVPPRALRSLGAAVLLATFAALTLAAGGQEFVKVDVDAIQSFSNLVNEGQTLCRADSVSDLPNSTNSASFLSTHGSHSTGNIRGSLISQKRQQG